MFGLFGLSVSELLFVLAVGWFVVWPLIDRARKARRRSRSAAGGGDPPLR